MSWYDLDDLFSRVELPDVARQLGMDVERRGANLITSCPFHEDTRPSLVLYPHDAGNRSHFHCFSCNTHGFAADLVMKMQGVEFKPAIEWLAHNLGITPKRVHSARHVSTGSTREDALSFALKVFDQNHDEIAFIEWCNLRQFNRDFLYNLGLRCLPIGSILVKALHLETFGRQQELIDGLLSAGLLMRLRPATKTNAQESLDLSEQFKDYFHDGRLLIPIHSIKNKLVGFAGRYRLLPNLNCNTRSEPAKYLLTLGFHKAENLFNAYHARQTLDIALQDDTTNTDLYVVEGFLDALRLQSLNFPAVAIMGTGLSDNQRNGLIALTDQANVPGSKHVTLRIFFDRDSAGFEGASRASRQLLGLPGVATEWIGFGERDKALPGKDPDEILKSLSHEQASSILNNHALPILGILIAASLGYKDATPLSNERWDSISRYPRERALLQAIRALRILSSTTSDWAQRFQELPPPHPRWITDLLEVLLPKRQGGSVALRPGVLDLNFLVELEARFNQARMLAEHGARRGELPCDEETWRALDRNAQLFNTLASYRLKQQTWHQVAPCDAVNLPRKLTSDKDVLNDPRRKVMPHAADLHLQQFLMNELLTERHDFSHEGPRNFSDCIPAVRWFATEGEVRVTGHVNEGESSPALHDHERRSHDEPVLSFAYQIDMEVLEGRRKPSDQGMFRPYIDCWRGFMESLKRQADAIGPYVYVLRLDVKRYYDSIQQYVVRDRLLGPIEQALAISGTGDISTLLSSESNDPKKSAKRIVDLLCENLFRHQYKDPDGGQDHYSADGIGIPQGPVISAWIGTIAMFPVDAAARTFMRQTDQYQSGESAKPRVGYARYVDDIVLLADSETNLRLR